MRKGILTLAFISLSLISHAQKEMAVNNYSEAFRQLNDMLNGRAPISFKKAVFISENAFVDNKLDYSEFEFQVDALSKLAKSVAASDGLIYSHRDKQQVLLAGAIFRVMKDSLVFESTDSKTQFRNIPFTYDMEDFWGEKDWTKMFVTKLLYEQTGNCHSLPALYKIIADEVGADAWLSIAPNHTYIKQWSEKTGWYNTELTTGHFPFDKDIKWNSYIKSEAISSGTYMDTLSSVESIAYIITDLAQGFVKKFGYDSLALPIRWLDVALSSYPDYPNALILKAELLKKQYEALMKLENVENFEELWSNLGSKELFIQTENAYQKVAAIGYRRMPKEMYLNWLFRVKKDTTRLPYKFRSPQPFKRYNYPVEIVTAGDGENYEFFDDNDLIRIGSVEFNRVTGKIVRFIPLDKEDMPDEVISRMYDPALGKFWQVDPLANKRFAVTPYNFVQNNPINRIDPSGLTDFSVNKKTGEVKQVGEANDDPDRVVKTDKNGNVKKKGEGFLGFLVKKSNRGEAKVAFGGIEKGILKDGQNFQEKHNIIEVGGKGQPSVAGVRDFALKFSNYLDKELGGYYLSNKGETNTSYVSIGPYKNNDATTENSGLRVDLARPDLFGKIEPTTDWHTHLSRFGDNDRLRPSSLSADGGDEGHKRRQKAINPSLRFIIITNESSTNTTAKEVDY